MEKFGELYTIRQIRQNFPPPNFSHVRYIISCQNVLSSLVSLLFVALLNSIPTYLLNFYHSSMYVCMLNKSTLGVKKCEANQKQHESRQARPKVLISAEAKKLPYSLKLSRTKIFVDFLVFEAPTKIYP